MATASAETEVITKTVTLVLSADEAQVIADAFHHVGGDPRTTPRGAADRVTTALAFVGIRPRHDVFEKNKRPYIPGEVTPLIFKDNLEV